VYRAVLPLHAAGVGIAGLGELAGARAVPFVAGDVRPVQTHAHFGCVLSHQVGEWGCDDVAGRGRRNGGFGWRV
jgi:hypothetical protein